MLNAVVVMDEAGLALKATRQVEAMAAYAAKMDCIYLFPSFFPPIRAAQVVTVQPVFSFVQIGLPVIVYRWRVKIGSFDDRGTFRLGLARGSMGSLFEARSGELDLRSHRFSWGPGRGLPDKVRSIQPPISHGKGSIRD